MAKQELTIGGGGRLFIGEDKELRFELVSTSDPARSVNFALWAMVFDVRRTDASEAALVSLTPTIVGVFNPVRATNTQRAVVTLTDDQMNLFRAGNYRWSWKRIDSGSETVLAWGTFAPQKATAP